MWFIQQGFITEQQMPILGPVVQQFGHRLQRIDRWDEGPAALLRRFDGVSLQLVLPHAVRALREIGLHRDDLGGA